MTSCSPFRRAVTTAALMLAAALACVPAHAADNDTVPYWASLRARQVNMHVGPGEDYRTSFRYHREDLPMKVLRKMEGWRLVQDPDGARGWMLARFLKPERGAIVVAPRDGGGLVEMRESADPAARLLWRLEPGVTGKLGACANGWCKFEVAGRAGFVTEGALWGSGNP
ncbi:SH3 domain-containing protein [Novosphingobium bradum]|uniref:SH3 domain-containing protein n=1 Tax=Novosphingobium bradum TaxID=1737444 RepID=A0ABV7ITT3_9SPHN